MIQRIGLLLFVLLVRFYNLGVRPPHHDEAVNGWFVDGIFQKGFYHYDPHNYHGPIFFYIITFFEMIFGRSIEVLRAPPVIFGTLLCFTPFLFKRWIGERGAWIAALFLVVSPACVFYSRYTIHETAFAVACASFLYYWLRARSEGLGQPSKNYLKNELVIGLGISLGAMAGLKENFVIYVGSIVMAEIVIGLMPKLLPMVAKNDAPFRMFGLAPVQMSAKGNSKNSKKSQKTEEPSAPVVNWKDSAQAILVILSIAFLIILMSFTAFGQDPIGLQNFFTAFAFWSETGSKGNGHQKPFYYWLELFFTYEWLALLGLGLSVLALTKVKTEIRLMSALGFGLWLAYSIVSYKTPWCLLSFYFVLVMVGSFWISKWTEKGVWRVPLYTLFGLGLMISSFQAFDVAYVNVDSDHHPYIYGQTFRTVMVPLNAILDKVKQNPALKNTMRIQIISEYTWPLPWVLGEIKQTAYHTTQNPPAVLDADYLLIDKKIEQNYVSRIRGDYSRAEYQARQWAAPMVFYEKHASAVATPSPGK